MLSLYLFLFKLWPKFALNEFQKNHKIIYLTELNSILNENYDNNDENIINDYNLDNISISQNIKNYINDIKSL